MAEVFPANADEDLEALARKRLGKLSEAELRLLRAVPKGDTAFCGPKSDVAGNDPAKADEWASEREIRAALISWLCVDSAAVKRIDPAGIQVYGAKIIGRLNLFFAAISFPLLFQRCRFNDDIDLKFATVPALNLSGSWIRSLIVSGTRVRADVSLNSGFTSTGEVLALQAQIGGTLDCRDGTFKNPGDVALAADRAEIGGSVLLNDGFLAKGEVRLPAVQVGCQLVCNRGVFDALNLQGVTIKEAFLWRDVPISGETQLDLTNASVGALGDDELSWPKKGNLVLDGFVYERITLSPTDAPTRLKWLDLQREFRTQPYLQLAKVLREIGDDGGGREVLFEMEDRRRKHEDQTRLDRSWSWILRMTIGYGQMSWRVAWWLLGLIVVGCMFSGLGYLGGAVVPNEKEAYEVFEQRGYPPDYYPQFNPFIYSVEHSFPLVSLGVMDHWAPTPAAVVRVPALQWNPSRALSNAALLGYHPFRLGAGWLLRWWLWFQTLVGWVLATLFVAGLTGVVRTRQ